MTLEESYLKNSHISLKSYTFLKCEFRIFSSFMKLEILKYRVHMNWILFSLHRTSITKAQSLVAKIWLIFVLVIGFSLPVKLRSSQEFHGVKFSFFMFSNF